MNEREAKKKLHDFDVLHGMDYDENRLRKGAVRSFWDAVINSGAINFLPCLEDNNETRILNKWQERADALGVETPISTELTPTPH